MKLIALCLLVCSLATHAAEVVIPVWLEPIPDPEVERQFAGVKRPLRWLPLPAAWRAELGDAHPIQIWGKMTDSELHSLLVKASLARHRVLGPGDSRPVKWHVEVITTGEFAKVRYAYVCGSLCGVGADLVLHRKDGVWRYLYKTQQWVS